MAIDPERLATVRAALEMIRVDARTDALALDGSPFNQRTVTMNLGQIYASIYSLAAIVDDLMAAVLGEEPTAPRLMDEATEPRSQT